MNSKNSFTHLSQVNLRVKFLQSTLFTLSAFLTDCNKSLSKVLIFSSVNTSMGPVTGYAAIGVPLANASSITFPKVSVLEGKTNTSAFA